VQSNPEEWKAAIARCAGQGSIGHMQTIKVDLVTGTITAGGDPRRTGYAMGY